MDKKITDFICLQKVKSFEEKKQESILKDDIYGNLINNYKKLKIYIDKLNFFIKLILFLKH